MPHADDPLEQPHELDPELAELEQPPLEPTDVDRGRALEAEARVKAARDA